MGNPTADIHQEEVTHTLHSDRVLTTDVGDDGFGGRRRLWRATTALAAASGFFLVAEGRADVGFPDGASSQPVATRARRVGDSRGLRIARPRLS